MFDASQPASCAASSLESGRSQSFCETPHAHITRQRMHRAQLIMLSSQQPLSQIALDCGMSDQAHLTRALRRLVGINPSLWRRQFSLGGGGAGSGRRW